MHHFAWNLILGNLPILSTPENQILSLWPYGFQEGDHLQTG